MKKNISINISGIIFHIEEDGYETLQRYLDSINTYFSNYEESEEIIADIEGRIAEIFLERLKDGQQVVSAEDVADLIKTMGNTADFEAIEEEADLAEEETQPQAEPEAEQAYSSTTEESSSTDTGSTGYAGEGYAEDSSGPRTLNRDLNNQLLGGVCSGIAHYLKIDAIWIRIAFILFLPAGGLSLIAYFFLWLIIPGSTTLKEHKSVKKLYRNPDDRVLGGVCSGVAKYLNIDSLVMRIIFIVLFFVGGIGFISYLILWAITPEASSITDKMQMEGEQVTLSNIDENIKKQKTEEDFGSKDEGAFTKVVLFPFRLIGKILSGISKTLAPLMLFIVASIRIFTGGIIAIVGLSSMFGIVVAAGVVLGLYNGDEWYYIDGDLSYIPYEVLDETIPFAGLAALLVALFIPFLYLFIAGITVIAKRKIMSSSVGWSILGIWLISIVIAAGTVPNAVMDFRDESSISYSQDLTIPGNLITIDVNDIYEYRRDRDIFLVDLDIRQSDTDQVSLDTYIHSRGRNRDDAEENAKMIDYSFRVSDSTISFDQDYSYKPGGRFRAQEVDLDLNIPEGRPFVIKRGTQDLIGSIRGIYWSKVYNNTWVFENGRMTCLTCTTRRNDATGSNDGFSETIDLTGVSSVQIRESFKVYIEQGDSNEMVIQSGSRNVDDVSSLISDGEVIVRAYGMDDYDARDIDVYITVSSLDKLYARESSDIEIKGFDGGNIELSLRNEARVNFDGTTENLDVELEDDTRLTVTGTVNELVLNLKNESRFEGRDANINSADITTANSARARLKVADYLRVDARGRSEIKYEGSPTLDVANKGNSATVERF